MKPKLGLLAVIVGAVALALVGVLRDVNTSKALMPLPVRPTKSLSVLDGLNTTALNQVTVAYGESAGGHGIRGTLYTNYGRGGYGNADIAIDDSIPLGDFLTTTDVLCDSTGPSDYDSVATSYSVTTPYTFDEVTTDLVAADQEYLIPQLAPYPMSARFSTDIDNIWLWGTVPYTLPTVLPLNIATLQVPWFPSTGITQIWLGGGPAKPAGQTCSDGAGGTSVSTTDGTATTPLPMTGNPLLVGDSAGPCDTGTNDCADKQIHGFWATPNVVTGTPNTVTVTKRVLNNGPEAGSFKDVWHAEAPSGVTAEWSTTVSADGTPFTANGGDEEIWFQEDDLAVGTTVEYEGSLTLTCDTSGDYLVAIKNVAYPKAGTVDNNLADNVSMSIIRVKCPAAGSEVDKQVITLASHLTSVSAGSSALNRPAGSGPGGEDPDGSHVQLVVGDTATLTFTELKRNQSHEDADSLEWLVAEAVDLDGGGTYDITLDWDDTSVEAYAGSDPAKDDDEDDKVNDGCDAVGDPETGDDCDNALDDDDDGEVNDGCEAVDDPETGDECTDGNLASVAVDSVTPISGGGMARAGLELTMTEPYGPMIAVTADLDITCDSAGRFLVPVKAVDMPTAHGDSNLANNVQWVPVVVYCWASAGDVEDDGTDDNTGLYPKWTTRETSGSGNFDLRKSVPPYPDTGMVSDTVYVERWVDFGCYWFDADGADDGGDGWVTPEESLADPDMPAGIDDDGDCLADPEFAQPGHPVDEDDDPSDNTDCPAIVYNEGEEPFDEVVYNQAADMDCDGLVDGIEKAWGSNPKLADSDGDGASDFEELFMLTNPVNPDTDGDGVLDKPEDDYIAAAAGSAESGETADADDNCPLVYNPDQANNDGQRRDNGAQVPGSYASQPNADKLGDACDTDDDNDKVLDVAELTDEGAKRGPTDPMDPDSDDDRCLDGVELQLDKDPNDAGDKCPSSLTPAQQTYYRGCHVNLPDPSTHPDFSPGYSGEDYVENDVDGDGILCPTDVDSDNGTGTGAAAPAEIVDAVEAFSYGTSIVSKDTDGDGCEDWIEIVDINGNRSAEILDVLFIAKRAFALIPASDSDYVMDIDKNGTVNVLDALVAAKNSSLVKSHGPCPSEG